MMAERKGLKRRLAEAAIRFLREGHPTTVNVETPPGPDYYKGPGGFVSRALDGTTITCVQGDVRRFEVRRGGHMIVTRPEGPPRPQEVAAAMLASGVGVSGLSAFGGVISDDYNTDLQNLQDRMDIYEQMRRSDAALAVMEALITMPILAAGWRLEGGDSETFRKRLWDDLQFGMTHPFRETLRQALLGVLYGFAIHQVIPETKPDGFEGIRKFLELGRKTVDEWDFDASGGVQGFWQTGYRLDTDEYVRQYLPIEQLIIWTWREDCGNPEGLGAYRQGYKHWRIKEVLEQLAAMRVERTCIPYLIWEAPPYNTNEDRSNDLLEICDRMIAGENIGVLEVGGWKLRLEWPGPSDVPFLDMIEWEHMNMLQGILGQFVGYGTGGQHAGAPLGRESASVFMETMNYIADWLCDSFNRYVIPKLWEWNHGTQFLNRWSKEPPRLAHDTVGTMDLDGLGRAIRAFLDKNTMMTPDLLNFLLQKAGMPPQDPEAIEKIVATKFSSGAGKQGGAGAGVYDESKLGPETAREENGLLDVS
jgi:hypothetical protein